MALIDHDEVEEIPAELGDIHPGFVARDRLVKGEVNFVGLIDLAVGDLGHGRGEGFEVVGLGLVDQDVAVGEEEDAFFLA